MSARVAGKVALITGGASGVGRASARLLAREGAQVVISDIDVAAGQALAQAIGPAALFLAHDAASEADWARVIDVIRTTYGRLDIVFNNAGILLHGDIEHTDYRDWQRVQRVNSDSVFLGCKLALPMMRECQPASIINLSSIAGLMASPNLAAYNASKAAVWLLTKSVALLAAKKGWDIRCNSIHPTFIRTPMLDDLRGDRDEAETLARLAKQVPLGRLGDPDDVAYAVLYMASDESRFITAAEFKIDGGISAI